MKIQAKIKKPLNKNLRRGFCISFYVDEKEISDLNEWVDKTKKTRTQYIRDVLFDKERIKF